MPEVIDVIGPQGGMVEVSAEPIAAIIREVCMVEDRVAAKAANLVIDYLVQAITRAEGAKLQ